MKKIPITIEDKRVKNPDIVIKAEKELLAEEDIDEFSEYFNGKT